MAMEKYIVQNIKVDLYEVEKQESFNHVIRLWMQLLRYRISTRRPDTAPIHMVNIRGVL